MKTCPKCNQTYTDENLNFCLNDGELLMVQSAGPSAGRPFDDPPPTVMMNDARVTNPTNWQQPSAPPAAWQGQQPVYQQPQGFANYAMATPNQTLAIVSLGLGIASLIIGWCCSLGLALSPAALITGFIALSQMKKDPQKYGGRGFAIGGIVTGSIFLAGYLLFIVLYGAAILFGGLAR